jgi:hypothetical protein
MRLLYQSVISGYIPISSFLLSGHWQSQGQQQGGVELNTTLEQQGGLCSLLKEIGKSGGRSPGWPSPGSACGGGSPESEAEDAVALAWQR